MGRKKNIPRYKRVQPLDHQKQDEIAFGESLKKSNGRYKNFKHDLAMFIKDGYSSSQNLRIVAAGYGVNTLRSKKINKNPLSFLKQLQRFETKSYRFVQDPKFIIGFGNICAFEGDFVRPVEDWKPKTRNPERQFFDLIRHLVCLYPVPDFLIESLLTEAPKPFCKWLVFLGQGGSVRDIENVPFRWTRKMGHHYMGAPKDLNAKQALRFAQVKGLGGDDGLAHFIAHSWFGRKTYEREPMWEHYFNIVIQAGMVDHVKVMEVKDYIEDTVENQDGYSLKGRTMNSLIRVSDTWHTELARIRRGRFSTHNLKWEPCGIKEFKLKQGSKNKVVEFFIKELNSSSLLYDEGQKMCHCVASYAQSCSKGASAIYSLSKRFDHGSLERLATIQIDMVTKQIVQAKAKMNHSISAEAYEVVQRWSISEGLIISRYV